MLSKSRVKFIQGLKIKKFRQKYSQFIVEGEKSVGELLKSSLKVESLYVVAGTNPEFVTAAGIKAEEISEEEMKKISHFVTPQSALAIVQMPEYVLDKVKVSKAVSIALDTIQDPGNLGTIIRIADWYGIDTVFCSENSADVFNPKTITATMGSFARVKVYYGDIREFLGGVDCPVYGCLLEGKSVHELGKVTHGVILIGNESKGISDDLISLISHPVTIPRFGMAESLNAAIATAIVCDNIRR